MERWFTRGAIRPTPVPKASKPPVTRLEAELGAAPVAALGVVPEEETRGVDGNVSREFGRREWNAGGGGKAELSARAASEEWGRKGRSTVGRGWCSRNVRPFVARHNATRRTHRSRGSAIARERGQFAPPQTTPWTGRKRTLEIRGGGTHLMVLPVRMRIHWGMGRFCFCFLPMIFLILKVLWDGCWRWWEGWAVGEGQKIAQARRTKIARP